MQIKNGIIVSTISVINYIGTIAITLLRWKFIYLRSEQFNLLHYSFLLVTITTQAVAIFPLNGRTTGKDVSRRRNPRGILGYVRPAPGPDGARDGSYQFYGRSNSYILFPNRGGLDTKRSITLLAWIYHEGRAGPIFNYMANGWGVHFWMISPRTLFVRFTRRRGRRFTKAVMSRRVVPRRWQFVGAAYNQGTGVAKLFVNARFTARKYLGRIRLATNYPVRMGARIGDRRYFRGRISCMQVYNGALSRWQIISKKRKCFRRSKLRGHVGLFAVC